MGQLAELLACLEAAGLTKLDLRLKHIQLRRPLTSLNDVQHGDVVLTGALPVERLHRVCPQGLPALHAATLLVGCNTDGAAATSPSAVAVMQVVPS